MSEPTEKATTSAKGKRRPVKTGAHRHTLVFRDTEGNRYSEEISLNTAKGRTTRPSMKTIIGVDVESRQDLVEQIREGFPVAAFTLFSGQLGISEKELGGFAGISPRTLARRKTSGHLESDESDRIARIAMLLQEAIELFEGDQEQAIRWLKSPKRALNGATPLEYADTEPGVQEVHNLIGRLEHGVYS